MYNKQFSIAALMVAGLFATGCSQQSAGGSQVSGGSQSQIEGGSQVAGSSQAGSQQQVEGGSQVAGSQQSQNETVVAPTKAPATVRPVAPPPVKRVVRRSGNCHGHAANSSTKSIKHCHPNPRGQHRYGNSAKKKYYPRGGRWAHTHPAVPGCTKSIRHTHKYKNARHSHQYSCKGKQRQARRNNQWGHTHAAIAGCTNSFRHSHKFSAKNHSHKYSCKGGRGAYKSGGKVDVHALQRKLKAKGYYKGPIDGIVGKGTRDALKRFMNR